MQLSRWIRRTFAQRWQTRFSESLASKICFAQTSQTIDCLINPLFGSGTVSKWEGRTPTSADRCRVPFTKTKGFRKHRPSEVRAWLGPVFQSSALTERE